MGCVVAVVVVVPSPAEVREVGVSYGGLFTRGDISSAIVESEGPTFLADHPLSVAVCVQGLVWRTCHFGIWCFGLVFHCVRFAAVL